MFVWFKTLNSFPLLRLSSCRLKLPAIENHYIFKNVHPATNSFKHHATNSFEVCSVSIAAKTHFTVMFKFKINLWFRCRLTVARDRPVRRWRQSACDPRRGRVEADAERTWRLES